MRESMRGFPGSTDLEQMLLQNAAAAPCGPWPSEDCMKTHQTGRALAEDYASAATQLGQLCRSARGSLGADAASRLELTSHSVFLQEFLESKPRVASQSPRHFEIS